MDAPICKICLEPNNLLIDICNCRGTIGGIHLMCLKQLIRHEQTCSICKIAYSHNLLHPLRHGQPLFWNIIGSRNCETLVWGLTAITLRFLHFKIVLVVQLLLLTLYTIAYAPVFAKWLTDPQYKWRWMRQWFQCAFFTIATDGRKLLYVPFPTTVAYFLLPLIPGSLAVSYSYNKLWHIHLAIVEQIMIMDLQDR